MIKSLKEVLINFHNQNSKWNLFNNFSTKINLIDPSKVTTLKVDFS